MSLSNLVISVGYEDLTRLESGVCFPKEMYSQKRVSTTILFRSDTNLWFIMAGKLNNDEGTWEIAGQYAGLVKTLPDRVSYLLKVLREEHIAGNEAVSDRCLNYVREIDKLKPLKVPIYFGASHLVPDKFNASEDDTSKALLAVLGPGMFFSLLITVWFYRRLGKLVPATLWERFSANLLAEIELGYEVGCAVPDLGPSDGLIFATVRGVGLGAFALQDEEQYGRYLNLHKGKVNLEYEVDRFMCDHSQIGVYLLQTLHMMKTMPDGNRFEGSLLEVRESILGRIDSETLTVPWLKNCALVGKAIAELYTGMADYKWLKEYGASDDAVKRINGITTEMLSGTRNFSWLGKGRS